MDDFIWLVSHVVVSAYGLLLIICVIGFRNTKNKTAASTLQKSVAVVIAIRNEAENIPTLLQALEAQETDAPFEVIIVDDHSEDGSLELVRKHWAKKIQVQVLESRGKGKKDALTTGILSTAAEVILITDADCIPDAGWVATMANEFNDPYCTFACGMVRPKNSDGVLGATLAIETVCLQVVSVGMFKIGNPIMCNGANMSFTRQFFTNVQGFTNDTFVSGDDAALLAKAKMYTPAGIRWVKSQHAMVSAPMAVTMKDAITQRHRWLSKANGFSSPVQTIAAIVFLALQLFLPAILLFELLNWGDNPFISTLLIKMGVELLLLSLAASFFKEANAIIMLPVSIVLYCIISIGAVFRLFSSDVEWKGRTWRKGRVR